MRAKSLDSITRCRTLDERSGHHPQSPENQGAITNARCFLDVQEEFEVSIGTSGASRAIGRYAIPRTDQKNHESNFTGILTLCPRI